MLLIVIGVGMLAVWTYILFGRSLLLKAWPDGKVAKVIEVADNMWAKSRTILVARGYQLVGILVAIQGILASSGYDITPIATQVMNAATFIPADLRAPLLGMFFILTGAGFEYLRRSGTPAPGKLTQVETTAS